MSKAATLPPWEVTPSWGEKRQAAPIATVTPVAPVAQAAETTPSAPRVRFAHLENTTEPVSAPPQPQRAPIAHRKTVSLPRNPRPVRPKVPENLPSIDTTVQSASNPTPISATERAPATLEKNPTSNLPVTRESPPTPNSSLQSKLPLNTSYPSPPSSNISPITPSKPREYSNEDTNNNKSLPPPPSSDILPYDTANTVPPPPVRTSRFQAFKRSMSLKILPQNSSSPQSPNPPTPDLPWSSSIGPPRSLNSSRRPSKTLASPNFNEEVFAWIQTDGSRIVAAPDEKEAAEYGVKSPRNSKSSSASGGTNGSTRSKSRRLASPGYIKEKYSLGEIEVVRDRSIVGDVAVSGGRSPGLWDQNKPNQSSPNSRQSPPRPARPDDLSFSIHDINEERVPPSPKAGLPPTESTTLPMLIPLRYVPETSPKEAPPGPAAPKLIPLKFLSPPSPDESEDESNTFTYDNYGDEVGQIDILPPPVEIAPLRLKSRENTPTVVHAAPSSNSIDSTNTAPSSLTTYMLSHATPRKLYSATHSTFLSFCSNGRLSLPLLSRYLTQERIFLQTYLRFLSLLLANVSVAPQPRTGFKTPKPDMDINTRLTPHLITQLSYTQSQLAIFSSLCVNLPEVDLESWEEGTEDGMSDATRMLVRLFDVIGSAIERGEKSVLVGVLVCWVREHTRLQAWQEISTSLSTTPIPFDNQNDAAQIITQYLLPAWTGPETVDLMGELRGLLDEIWGAKHADLNKEKEKAFAERGEGRGKIERGWEVDLREFEEMGEMVLGIMGRGWPEVVLDDMI